MLLVLVSKLALAGPVVVGEVGGDAALGNADTSYKLGAVAVTHSSRLLSIAPWLEYDLTSNGPDEIEYVVYGETGPGDWELLWNSGPVAAGLGPDFHPSRDEIGLLLERGRRYAMGVFLYEGDYDYAYDDPAAAVDLGWGVFEGAIWSPEGSDYSVPAQITGQTPDTHGYWMQISVEILDADGDGSLEDADCDEADPNNFPGNPEQCDGLDNDCTGVPDDPVVYVDWFVDADGDGYGDPATAVQVCDGSAPAGLVAVGTDCDDANIDIHPDHPELCDGIDEDCDGTVDDDPVYRDGWVDADLDGFGDPTLPQAWCEPDPPAGIVTNDEDCNDASAVSNPLGVELCDGLNNDCDLLVDEGFDVQTWWADTDGDGAGDALAPIVACALPAAASANPNDCDDTDPERFPENPEVCDGKDNNCDTLLGGEGDFDEDGFIDCEDCGSDDPDTYPGAPEDGCDGIDHDCDGDVPPSSECDEDDEDPKDESCGCDSSTGGTPFAPLLGLLMLAARRRRLA